jgi:nicotinamide mononucleotide transporter
LLHGNAPRNDEARMSIWEIIGTVLGVVGVWLMIRQNIWAWPVGMVQVAVYAWVFYGAKLYSDVILQGCFFLMQGYGWWHWLTHKHTASHSELPVTRLAIPVLVGWIFLGAAATAGWGAYMSTTDAALPHWDAFILVFSLIAQWLQARKKLECWVGWLAVNSVAIGVYWVKDLRLTAGLYVIFWVMALWGWREWRRTFVGPVCNRPGQSQTGPT